MLDFLKGRLEIEKLRVFVAEISLNMHIAMHDFFAYSFELLISLRIIQQQVYPKKIHITIIFFLVLLSGHFSVRDELFARGVGGQHNR